MGSREGDVAVGWLQVNSAMRQGQLLGWGESLGRYCLLIFVTQRTKFSGRADLVIVYMSYGKQGAQAGYVNGMIQMGDRIMERVLKNHLSPISMDRLGN